MKRESSKFNVGDRVRIVGLHPESDGREGIVRRAIYSQHIDRNDRLIDAYSWVYDVEFGNHSRQDLRRAATGAMSECFLERVD